MDTQELQKEQQHRGIQMHTTRAQEAQAQITSLEAKLGEHLMEFLHTSVYNFLQLKCSETVVDRKNN